MTMSNHNPMIRLNYPSMMATKLSARKEFQVVPGACPGQSCLASGCTTRESDSDDVSSTTDSESEQIRPKAKSTGGQSATKRQSTARLPLYDAPLQNDPGPSSPSLLPLPPHVMMVEMQHPGSSAPLHAPPPRNELPTYEQLEASFNSVHSGTGRMFQAAALEVHTAVHRPRGPPMGDSMADYLSTQEIHTKAMEGTKSSIMMSLIEMKEEDRLAAVVTRIDEEGAIVPRGAYIKTALNEVTINRSFQGLSFAEAKNLHYYVHFKETQTGEEEEKVSPPPL
eukprot:Em0019g852a